MWNTHSITPHCSVLTREKVIQRPKVPKILQFLVKVTALWCPQGFCNGYSCFHCPPVLTCLALIQESVLSCCAVAEHPTSQHVPCLNKQTIRMDTAQCLLRWQEFHGMHGKLLPNLGTKAEQIFPFSFSFDFSSICLIHTVKRWFPSPIHISWANYERPLEVKDH